jgi:type I restriction enzyme S subunit
MCLLWVQQGQTERTASRLAKGPGVVVSGAVARPQEGFITRRSDYWPHNTCLYVTDFLGNSPRFAYYLLQTLTLGAYNSGSAQPSLNRNFIYSIPLKVHRTSLSRTAIVSVLQCTRRPHHPPARNQRHPRSHRPGAVQVVVRRFRPRARQDGRPRPRRHGRGHGRAVPGCVGRDGVGVVPKGWRVGTLDSIAALNPESWSSKHHPDRLLYVDLANTKENQIEGITEFAFDEAPSRARRVLREGDVIVGTVRPGNRSFARISVDRTGLTGSTGFAVLRAHHHSDQALVYIAATRDEAIERLAHLADGGAYPAVRPEVVAGTPVVIAPDSVRQAFGEVANHLLAGVGSNQEKSRYLADLRDTLLPRLISGQLRLPEVPAHLEAA